MEADELQAWRDCGVKEQGGGERGRAAVPALLPPFVLPSAPFMAGSAAKPAGQGAG